MPRTLFAVWTSIGLLVTAIATAEEPRRHKCHNVPAPTWGYSPATVAESWARGQADLWRAYGDAEKSTAEAACDRESARKAWLQNKRSAVELYFELRELNHNKRFGNPSQRTTFAQHSKKPARPVMAVLQADGTIAWPTALRADSVRPMREQIDSVLCRRNSGLTSAKLDNDFQAIKDSLIAMRDDLHSRIKSLPPSEYIEAKNALKHLANGLIIAPQFAGESGR